MGVLKLPRNVFFGGGKEKWRVEKWSHPNLRGSGWLNPTWIKVLYSLYSKYPILCSMWHILKIGCYLKCNHIFRFSLFWISLAYEFILISSLSPPLSPTYPLNQQLSLWVMASFCLSLCAGIWLRFKILHC